MNLAKAPQRFDSPPCERIGPYLWFPGGKLPDYVEHYRQFSHYVTGTYEDDADPDGRGFTVSMGMS